MIEAILERVIRGESVQQALPGGGVLRIDRGLPYLLVYRQPRERADPGTERLVATEAAYLLDRSGGDGELAELVRGIAEAGSKVHNGFLVLEIWSAADPASERFVVHAPVGPAPETVGRLLAALESIREIRPGIEVAVDGGDVRQPPELSPLLSIEESWQGEILLLGLEVPPIYRDPQSGEVDPRFLRDLQRSLSRAVRQALYEFVRVQTSTKVENALALGTRTPPHAIWEIDRTLCEIEHAFDLLLLTSPVNWNAAWTRFQAAHYEREPEFHYRLLPIDPDLLKRRLFAIQLETIDDPALADLFEDKRQELDTQLTMLRERGSRNFRYGSQRLYGEADEPLRRAAIDLLDRVARPGPWQGEWVDADTFRARAIQELAHYRRRYPAIHNTIEVRRDVAGMMVSEGNLLIGRELRLRADRVVPLLHHEVGTHVLTYVNGRAQPLELLSLGLAGYDGFQEGLAVLAEYLVGGLDRLRMRLLAARVLAAHSVEQGAGFVETFRLLTREYDYTPQGAWHVALRVHASGGFTRDLIYLRGLIDLLGLLAAGTELAPLYLGKIARKHLPILEELRHREVLVESPLTPRFLEDPGSRERLAALRRGIDLQEMICPDRP